MNKAYKAWCRIYQTVFRLAMPILPYYEPKIMHSTDQVSQVLAGKRIGSVLLVTDPGIARLGLTHGLEAAFAQVGIDCTVYANTQVNPTVSNVEEAAALYRENGCRAIIGFGGGSAMDCAKGVGARIAQPAKPIQKMRGLLRVHRALPPLVAVPTTAGTGSEVTLAAVITDEKSHYKYPINDFALIPRYAVHDWRLTRGLPPAITGQTGMDALTHAVEAYVGRSTTRHTRRMATQAVRLVHDNLLDAYRNGDDERARTAMMEAAYKAGVAFTQSYVGYVHAIAHSLGGQYGTPHGLANAVILPHVLRAYGDTKRPLLFLAVSGVLNVFLNLFFVIVCRGRLRPDRARRIGSRSLHCLGRVHEQGTWHTLPPAVHSRGGHPAHGRSCRRRGQSPLPRSGPVGQRPARAHVPCGRWASQRAPAGEKRIGRRPGGVAKSVPFTR